MQGVISSKIYIPEEDANLDIIKKYYEIHEFNEVVCQRCKYKNEKPNEYCENCPSYLGLLKLWSKKRIKENNYITIPSGNLKRANKITGIDFSTYKDIRCTTKFPYPLTWTGKLRKGEIVNDVKSPNQEIIANKWLEKKYGFIQAPPRTGKSVLGTYISCKIGYKTLIIAHQKELLENFMKSFERDTNLLKLREETGKDIVKIINNLEKELNDDLCVALITYQKFIRETTKEEKIRKFIKNKWGFIIVDEAHQTGASAYAQFLGQIDARYKLGLSATPLRKDCLNEVILNIIGPVTVKSEATGLVPRIEILETGCKVKSSSAWVYTLKNLQKNEQRNKLILKEISKDLKKHKCILIPVNTINHMEALVNSINDTFGADTAVCYYSKLKNRKTILKEIDEGKYKVVVAIYSMIKQGIDLLLPSIIYVQFPISAAPQPKGSPMFYQMGNRVCTPYSGKPEPIIKLFIDPIPESIYCFLSLFLKEIKPGLSLGNDGKPKYTIGKNTYDFCWKIVKDINNKTYSQEGVYNPEWGIERPKKKEFSWW